MSLKCVGIVGTNRDFPKEVMIDSEPVQVVSGPITSVRDTAPDFIVAFGETTASELAYTLPDSPVIPVGAIRGLQSIAEDEFHEEWIRILRSLRSEPVLTVQYPVLQLECDAGTMRCLYDFQLVGNEPALISEFTVYDGETIVDTIRADGIVGATAAGSCEYNLSAGGPIISPGLAVLSVLPIAPFTTDPDHWILPVSDVSISIEREDPPIELLVDGVKQETLNQCDTIQLTHVGTIDTVHLPDSTSIY